MKQISGVSARLLFWAALLLVTKKTFGDERILSFNSQILIFPNNTMKVTETIIINSEHRLIKHGIYRDFPTTYTTSRGLTRRVNFDVISVTFDGRTNHLPYHVQSLSNGQRVYMGSTTSLASTGEHTYELTYTTNRQIGFFDDHDELYWNVGGDGWIFPKDVVSCYVILPTSVVGTNDDEVQFEGYTGHRGERGRDYVATFDGDQTLNFTTTRALAGSEDLTIVVSFPKGMVHEPTTSENIRGEMRDNPLLAVALIVNTVLIFYALLVVCIVGPKPRQHGNQRVVTSVTSSLSSSTPPYGMSAASVRYLLSKGGGLNKCMACVLVSLCAKRWTALSIFKSQKNAITGTEEYVLTRACDGSLKEPLSREEQIVFDTIFTSASCNDYKFSQSHCRTMESAKWKLASSLRDEHDGKHLRPVSFYFSPALILCVLWIICTAIASSDGDSTNIPPPIVLSHIFTFLLLFLLYQFLEGYTPQGLRVVDELESFKRFLLEKKMDNEHDEQSFLLQEKGVEQQPPERRFEKYLPYAVSLGIEKHWSSRFLRTLSGLNISSAGNHCLARDYIYLSTMSSGTNESGIGTWLESTVSSASTPPGSSSGSSGGGSAGGGGGGGGGGGW